MFSFGKKGGGVEKIREMVYLILICFGCGTLPGFQ